MHLLVRVSAGETEKLYVRRGDKLSAFVDKARAHFNNGFGVDSFICGTKLPDRFNNIPLIKINNSLCPEEVCPLYPTEGRKVYFRGSTRPAVVFIGEAPGEREAESGIPFVGPSGQVLDKIIHKMGFREGDYAITNTVLCHPKGNRAPTRIEQICCSYRLFGFLAKTKPQMVVFVGRVAADFFFPLIKLRQEKSFDVNLHRSCNLGAVRFLHIRHPAYWLRRGGFEHKSNEAEITEMIEAGVLVRDLMSSKTSVGKRGWDWAEKHAMAIRRELLEGQAI